MGAKWQYCQWTRTCDGCGEKIMIGDICQYDHRGKVFCGKCMRGEGDD